MKKFGLALLILIGFTLMAFMPAGEKAQKPIYLNTAYSFEERAADLVSRLSLEEKQSLLGNNARALKSENIDYLVRQTVQFIQPNFGHRARLGGTKTHFRQSPLNRHLTAFEAHLVKPAGA